MTALSTLLFALIFSSLIGFLAFRGYRFGLTALCTHELTGRDALRRRLSLAPALAWVAWFAHDLYDMLVDPTGHNLWPFEILFGLLLWFLLLVSMRAVLTAIWQLREMRARRG